MVCKLQLNETVFKENNTIIQLEGTQYMTILWLDFMEDKIDHLYCSQLSTEVVTLKEIKTNMVILLPSPHPLLSCNRK